MNINVIIGIIMILSFLGMVWYCVKGFNLMVGFAIMATFWTALAVVGNAFSPTSAMEGKTFIQVLEYVYAEGPAGYAKSILVNVFFGAFFGRVLVDTGIAATLIRKVVELGGDKPRITMALLWPCLASWVLSWQVSLEISSISSSTRPYMRALMRRQLIIPTTITSRLALPAWW